MSSHAEVLAQQHSLYKHLGVSGVNCNWTQGKDQGVLVHKEVLVIQDSASSDFCYKSTCPHTKCLTQLIWHTVSFVTERFNAPWNKDINPPNPYKSDGPKGVKSLFFVELHKVLAYYFIRIEGKARRWLVHTMLRSLMVGLSCVSHVCCRMAFYFHTIEKALQPHRIKAHEVYILSSNCNKVTSPLVLTVPTQWSWPSYIKVVERDIPTTVYTKRSRQQFWR